jgi:hypothetical protein
MKLTVVFVALLLGACSDELSDDDVHPAIVNMVKTLEADGDCFSLQAAFDRTPTSKADELEYIDAALRRTGCYGD